MDFLARTIGSLTGSNGPFQIGSLIPDDPDFPSIWNIYEGKRKSDNTQCTVFVFDSSRARISDAIVLAKNMASKLKKLRIPGVLKIIDSVETDSSVIIGTEAVKPLYSILGDLSLEAKLWGISNILRTLSHIHKEAKCIHGNINLGTVYMTELGEWALGGLELSINGTGTANSGDERIAMLGELVPGQSLRLPPESSMGGGRSFQKPDYALDTWQMGNFIVQTFNGPGASLNSRGKVPLKVWNLVKKHLMTDNPQQRVPISKLVANSSIMEIFKTDIDYVSDNIKTLSMSTDTEFCEYLDHVNRCISTIPSEYMARIVLPELCKCVGMNKGGLTGVSSVLTFSSSLTENQFTELLCPLIVKLYSSPDRAIRMELLNKLPEYIEKMDSKTVSGRIYPAFSLGLSDTEPAIRELTVKSIAVIVDKLSERIINGELLRLLAKTHNDSVPEIRANTTILLGKIANKFSSSTRSGVLVAAYARALKDPFVTSRIAALMALSATSEYFSPQECASKLVGALAPSLLDKDKSVREQSNVTMDILMKKIAAQAAKLDGDENSTKSSNEWHTKLLSNTMSFSSSNTVNRTSSAPPEKLISQDSNNTFSNASANGFSSTPEPEVDDSWAELVDDLDNFGWGEQSEEAPTVTKITKTKDSRTITKEKVKPLKLNKPKTSKLVLEDTGEQGEWGWD